MSLRERVANWLYPEIKKKDAAQDAAYRWHTVPKCKFCQRPLMMECIFCPHCGFDLTERHTTAQMKLATALPRDGIAEWSPSVTDLIALAWQPKKQRLKDVYNWQILPLKKRKT